MYNATLAVVSVLVTTQPERRTVNVLNALHDAASHVTVSAGLETFTQALPEISEGL